MPQVWAARYRHTRAGRMGRVHGGFTRRLPALRPSLPPSLS
jgi:hypothetical protein